MAHPTFSLQSDSYSTELEITSLSGTESISRFFELKITFKVKNDIASNLDHSLLTQENITLCIDDIESRNTNSCSPYLIKGMFHEVEEIFEQSNTHKFYTGIMVPTLWRQRNNQSYDIFTDATAQDILDDELSNDLMIDYHLSLSQPYPKKEFICQYSESNFHFVSRLAEHWGIYYYFDHDQAGRLVFADDTNYEPLPIPVIKLDQSNNPTHSFNSIRTLRKKYNSVPDAVIISETNPDQAMELFQGIAGDPAGDKTSVNMADEGADNKDEADLLAKIRLEELSTYKVVFSGTTGIPCITPGFVLTVETPSGEQHEILVTHVSHSGNNLDNPALVSSQTAQPYYECTFTGIPKETQYRPERSIETPKVISTTGRVYSAANDQTLAQRNEVGKYQVTFDFMLGEEDKISNWIRHASHTARSNHFDMPLTPGTEVQIGFIGGNPNRPYILNALENSQSVLHPVTHENPHHAAMITDGMLYTGALKSRQSLHMTANLDPAKVKEHISNEPFMMLDENGINSCEKLDLIKGDAHIHRTYGNQYHWREGIDFNHGYSAIFNFGQQYVENHADAESADNEVFELPGLDSNDSPAVNKDIQQGLKDERNVGLVQKDFGNKYYYHQGHAYNWSTGFRDQGIHKTFNFGGCYIENNTGAKAPSDMLNDFTSGFSGSPKDSDLITKTIGNTFDLQEGDKDEAHTGNLTTVMTGDTKETITGNITTDLTGDTTETITGNITTTLTGDTSDTITGNTTTTKTGDDTVTHIGNQTLTTTGDIISTHTGSITASDCGQNQTSTGNWMASYFGAYAQITGAMATENYMGGKLETHHGLLIANQKGELWKREMSINDVKTVAKKSAQIAILTASLIMHG